MHTEKPQPVEQIEAWKEKLDNLIRQMVVLSKVRYLYRAVQEMASQNPDLQGRPNLFRGWWMPYTYVHTILIGARRLADKHRKSESPYQLLGEIRNHASLITKEWYLQRAEKRLKAIDEMEIMSGPEFDKLWEGKEELKEKAIRTIKEQMKEAMRQEIEQEFEQTWAG